MDAQTLRDRTQRFATDVRKFCEGIPRDSIALNTTRQLNDAAHSVAQNYRAACRARSHDEFVAKICITVEEADEVQGWLDGMRQNVRIPRAPLEIVYREATELLKILCASKHTALRNQALRRAAAENAKARRRR